MDGVAELAERADDEPEVVLDSIDDLRGLLETGTTFERNKAVLAIARAADAYPTEVATATDELAAQLDHEEAPVRYHAAIALVRIGAESPESVTTHLPALADRLDAPDADPDADVREMASLAIDNVAEENPSAVGTVVPELSAVLDDERKATRRYAAAALRRVAATSPEAVTPAAADLVGRLDDEATVSIALEALGHLVDEYADDVQEGVQAAIDRDLLSADALDDVADSLGIDVDADSHDGSTVDPGTATQRESVESLDADTDTPRDRVDELAELAESNPQRVRSEISTLEEALRSESVKTRNRAAIACKRLAESDPEAAGHVLTALADRLDDDSGPVRHNAAFAIQYLASAGDDRVLGILDDIADLLDDPKVGVRDSATKVLFAVASDHPEAVAESAPEFHERLTTDGAFDPALLRGYASTESLRSGGSGITALGETPSFDVDRPCSFCYFTISGKIWGCPHAAAEGHDRCPFHLGPGAVPDSDVVDAFLRAVDRPGELTKEFYGAHFGDFDIGFEALDADDNYPIVMTNATFEGTVDLSDATIHHDLYCNGATFEQPVECTSTRFDAWANFDGATFEDDANFSRTRFLGQAAFDEATFAADATFVRAEFARRSSFDSVRIEGDAGFAQSKFRMAIHFSEAVVGGDCSFHSCSFEGRLAGFDDVSFAGETTFAKSTFDAPARFTDAAFGDETSLYGVTFHDSALFSNARFDDELDCDSTTFDGLAVFRETSHGGRLTVDHATFLNQGVFRNASFSGPVSFSESETANDLEFQGASFQRLSFDGATLGGELDLSDTEIDGELDFSGVRLDGQLLLDDADVGGKFVARRPEFARGISASSATLSSGLDFVDAAIAGGNFEDIVFHESVSLSAVTLTAPTTFEAATFRGPLEADLTCESTVDFSSVAFEGATTFDGSTFADRVEFDDATIGDTFSARNARLADARFGGTAAATDEIITIDLTGTDFERGHIGLPSTPMVYDLTDGTLGAVSLDAADGIDLFDSLRLVNTTFDGFDFGPHKDALEALNWALHTGHDGTTDLTAGTLENTYLNAKNGASAVGDDTAAAEFFIKEMAYRRRKHGQIARSGGSVTQRITSGWKWFSNLVLDVCCGYGERPSRTVLSSFATIVGFAALYAVMGIELPYEGVLGYLTFSVNAFVSLLLGTPSTSSALVSLLVALQGFLGAFIIALFVFTLTRSVNR